MRVLKKHKINVTMRKNGRQERGSPQGIRVLLEMREEGNQGSGIRRLCVVLKNVDRTTQYLL
jgi:hypothetical protein